MITAIASAAPALFSLVDSLFTSDEEKAEAKRKLVEMEQAGDLEKIKGQLAINLQEAKHESLWVAGWRPFIGWVCGTALAYSFILQPFLVFLLEVGAQIWSCGVPVGANGSLGARPDFCIPGNIANSLPELHWGALMTILGGLLGLGGMRSVEKIRKANKNR